VRTARDPGRVCAVPREQPSVCNGKPEVACVARLRVQRAARRAVSVAVWRELYAAERTRRRTVMARAARSGLPRKRSTSRGGNVKDKCRQRDGVRQVARYASCVQNRAARRMRYVQSTAECCSARKQEQKELRECSAARPARAGGATRARQRSIYSEDGGVTGLQHRRHGSARICRTQQR